MIRVRAIAVAALALAVGAPAAHADDTGDTSARSSEARSRKGGDKLGRDNHKPSAKRKLVEDIKKIWAGPNLLAGTTAVYVVDAKTGKQIYAVHEDEPLNPASNVKLISTATALDVMGHDYTYQTAILGPTPDSDGVLAGDIFLLGDHDPLLGANDLGELATELADSGISVLAGDIVVGDDARDGVLYSKITIKVSPGANKGDAPVVTVSPKSSFIEVDNTATTSTRGRTKLKVKYRLDETNPDGTRYVVALSGAIRKGWKAKTYTKWVPKKGLYAAHLLQDAMAEAGIEITGTIRYSDLDEYVADATAAKYLPLSLASHSSIPMSRIVSKINKRSINWLADSVIKKAGAIAYGGDPSMKKGVKAMNRWLSSIGISEKNHVLDTGSGLSYKTQLTARQIVTVLREAGGLVSDELADASDELSGAAAEAHKVFLESLSVAGVDGTLRRRFRESKPRLEGNIIGKTGTLTKIIALSGILTLDNDNAVVFSLVTNDHGPKKRTLVRQDHEKLVEAMYRYLRTR